MHATLPSPHPPPATPPDSEHDRLVDAIEGGRRLSLSSRAVCKFADEGKIPGSIRLGGVRRWRLAEITGFVRAGCKMPVADQK
jgi:predicted DNA-binding transcriptional regulator AlpA